MLPAQPWKNWFWKLGALKQVIKWSSESALLVDRTGGRPGKLLNEEKVDWVVPSFSIHA